MTELLTVIGMVLFRLFETIVTSMKNKSKFDLLDIIKEFFKIG